MNLFEKYQDDLTTGKKIVLGVQHTFTMFGATVLVPILTGLDISVALFMAGIGTLLFHLITRGKIPVFLGSSFAFITPIVAAAALPGGMPVALGGIVVAGLIYLLLALLVYFLGADKIIAAFPPIVTGPIIMVIGLKLAPTAISMASGNWWLAIVAFAIVAVVSIFVKGFFKLLPVLSGLVLGYLIAAIFGQVDFAPVAAAKWFDFPHFTIAKFDFDGIMLVAPVAIATMVEHIGDVMAVGATAGKDFVKSPGLHRTLIGDGLATSLSAMFGGPANTTYSENTGVLALTKVYNPVIMRIAACFAILLSVIPKLSAIISTIPTAIIGGISIVLFGMISAIGGRTLVENKTDLTKARNLIIAASILVLGLGGADIPIVLGKLSFTLSSMAVAAIIGIVLNGVLPDRDKPVSQR